MLKCLPEKSKNGVQSRLNEPKKETLNALLNYSKALRAKKVLDHPVLINLN